MFFCLFTTTNPLHAQWVQTNGPSRDTIYALAVSGTNLFAGTNGGVFLSTNNGSSWTAASTGFTTSDVFALAVSGTNLFGGTYYGGVFLSTNNGASWTAAGTGYTTTTVRSLAVSGTNLFAGTDGGVGVYLSTNNGASWIAAGAGLTINSVPSLAVSGTNLFAGTYGGVFRSTNNGTSWTAASTGLANTDVRSLAVSGTNLFAGTYGGVFLSTNNGASWTAASTGLTNATVFALAVSGTNLFAGTFGGGVFLSTNNGTSWTAASTGLANTDVRSLAVSGANLFAGTYGGGVFRALESALPVQISSISATAMISGVNLKWRTETEINNYGFEIERRFLNGFSDGWKTVGFVAGQGTSNSPHDYSFIDGKLSPGRCAYRLKQVDLDGSFKYFGDVEVDVPTPLSYALEHNYPNPFNSSTGISFELPDRSIVTLKIVDLFGRTISDLANGDFEAGHHRVIWIANVASGMYFYRIEAVAVGDPTKRFVDVKKMILVK